MAIDGIVLRYLFTAGYEDGTFFEQRADDKSLLFPGRSSFTDALAMEKAHGRIVMFALHRTDDSGEDHDLTVDLETGIFRRDGAEFVPGDNPPPLHVQLRLIFFRQHQENTVVGGNGTTHSHTVRYCLGWQATDTNGKNLQQVVGVY